MTDISFGDLDLPLSVRTTNANPITVFFNPVLTCAKSYDVAVGFFSSNWVRDAAEGIAKFAINGGRARWIISPILNDKDYKALQSNGTDEAREALLRDSFADLFEQLREDTRRVLSWMIRDGIMEFRVAIPKASLSGMMHAKMGVFSDESGNKIGFSGSYNLTGAAGTNWEKIDIFDGKKSTESVERITEIEEDFVQMWEGLDVNIDIFTPSEKALEKFVRHAEKTPRPYPSQSSKWLFYGPPQYLLTNDNLRDYQEEAIEAWLKKGGRGLFAMATGSGKTVTALAAAARIANNVEKTKRPLAIIITVPYQHLADQWLEEAKSFNFAPVLCYGGVNGWTVSAQRKLTELHAGLQNVLVFIAVNDTFSGDAFQKLVSSLPKNTLLIADEVHNLGALHYSKNLPENVQFRLGLSATPVRHGDEVGTKAIEDYFGSSVFEFSLKDAIGRDFLCPYKYYPVLSPLDEDEMAEYKDLSDRIAKAFARNSDEDSELDEVLKGLLIKRARLISRLKSKTRLLVELLSERRDSAFNLVYCGDAKEDGERQIEKVVKLIGRNLEMRVNKFTADENSAQRKHLLDEFSRGELQVLAAIRCLDEGVDVPRTETAYILASSSNPRQFIQRRGRVLRKSPGKKVATIFDFVAVPDPTALTGADGKISNVERRLVSKELERINEFAGMALNKGEALGRVNEIKSKLNLLDL